MMYFHASEDNDTVGLCEGVAKATPKQSHFFTVGKIVDVHFVPSTLRVQSLTLLAMTLDPFVFASDRRERGNLIFLLYVRLPRGIGFANRAMTDFFQGRTRPLCSRDNEASTYD